MRLRAAALALAALTACKPKTTADAGATPRRVARPVATAPAAPAPGRGAQIFVDVSESNRGFTGNGSRALATLHAQVIEASLSALQRNNPFVRCTVDNEVHCGRPGITAQQLAAPAVYRGSNANLHLALRRPPRAPRPDLQQPDPLDPYAVTIVVTDGFQSTSAAFQPGATSDVACTAGADPSCLAALLRARVDEGYGLWVGRLLLGFDGRYFAERRLDRAMWARTLAHVEALNADPLWNGVRFAAASPSFTSESGVFRFTGARPLMLFILSRDIAAGRRLVAEMQRRLAVERMTVRGIPGDIAFSEWAPFEGITASVTAARRAENGGAADHVLVDRTRRDATGFEVPVRCDLEGVARIRVDGVTRMGSLPPPRFARVGIGWQVPAPVPASLMVPREPMRPVAGAWVMNTGVNCTQLAAGEHRYPLTLAARWTVDEAALQREWFMQESGDTSFETPERVFGLADLARAVITAGVNRAGPLDRITLRVTRR